MFLIDTNVISEARKGARAHPGVQQFFQSAKSKDTPLYLSAVTVGELRRGVELIRHRGDTTQAAMLERWLESLLLEFADRILPLDSDAGQLWGRLRVPSPEHELDKQIAAIALIHDLTVVTRNVTDFRQTSARCLNPFVETSRDETHELPNPDAGNPGRAD